MSAIRTSGRQLRRAQSPYSRPAAKKSAWSIGAFFRSLNPWSSSPSDADDETTMQEDVLTPPGSPAASLRDRGHQIDREIRTQEMERITPSTLPQYPPPRTPLAKPSHSRFDAASPEKDLETVSARIRESLDQTQVQQLCAILQNDSTETGSQPFRFSSNTSTPARSTSPYQINTTGFSFGASLSTLIPTTSRKTLSKNPNGVYRWQGGGSAKTPRSRNRYSSPAFGPSRSTSDRLILKDTQVGIETPNSKRRKVAEEFSTPSNSGASSSIFTDSQPQPAVRASAPEPSPTRVKQALPFPASAESPTTPRPSGSASANGVSSPSTSRLRPLPQKPTAPVVPSPLRQAWSGASPPARIDDASTISSPLKQTKAANYMTELIKEITPPKRPDLSNPYQAASPLGKVATAPKGRVGRRARATGKPAAPSGKDELNKDDMKSGDKAKLYSPQAIIEATLPKGSKRSRPPAEFEKSSSLDGDTSPSMGQTQAETSPTRKRTAPYVEDASDEEDKDATHTSKKSKSRLAGNGVPTAFKMQSPSSSIQIEEVESANDRIVPEKPQSVTPPVSTLPLSSTAPGRSLFGGLKSASAPKEPSKLRYSYQPEAASSPGPALSTSLPGGSPLSVSPATSTPFSSSLSFPAPMSAPAFPFSTSSSIPSTSSVSSSAPLSSSDIVYKLPHNSDPTTAARQAALALPKSSLPVFTFSIKAKPPTTDAIHVAAISVAKVQPKSSLPQFNFSKEALQNAASSISVNANPRTPSTSAPVPFNWAGAGMKPPAASNDSTWTCSLCMLTNPSSATEQCEHCETKRPASVAPTTATQGFNWAAAGMKSPTTTTTGGNWTCSLCMLNNPSSATEQCEHCETKRPTSVPTTTTQGFNWTAAGMKPPTTGDNWTCSLCGLSNPPSATSNCDTCDSPRS